MTALERLDAVIAEMDGHIEICQTIRDHICPANTWLAELRAVRSHMVADSGHTMYICGDCGATCCGVEDHP